jgi:hypothetical protein
MAKMRRMGRKPMTGFAVPGSWSKKFKTTIYL